MLKIIREFINPELKSNKHYEYISMDDKKPCVVCGKKKRNGMNNREKNEFTCSACYPKHVGGEGKITLLKRQVLLISVLVIIVFVAQTAVIGALVLRQEIPPTSKVSILVDFFYPFTDTTISKDTLTMQIETILNTEYPELALAIAYRESRFNPSAVSSAGARGTFQVMNGWVKKLQEDGVIDDFRGLHDPKKGCEAGTRVLGYHLVKANGDMMAALRDYVGSKDKAGEVAYVRDVLATYGNIKLLLLAHETGKLEVKDIWWNFSKEKELKKQVNPTKKGRP